MPDWQEPLTEESREPERSPQRRFFWPQIFWAVLLIGAGIILLLQNVGYLPWSFWTMLWTFWPALLIILGIAIIFGRRSPIGTIIGIVLFLVLIGALIVMAILGQTIPWLANWNWSPGWQTAQIDHPRGEVEQASVFIDWTSVPGYLDAARDSTNLVEGEIDYRGDLNFSVNVEDSRADVRLDTHFQGVWFGPPDFDGERRWDVYLSPDVLLDLTLNAGSGSCDFDLKGLKIQDLYVDIGSGPVDLELPAGRSYDVFISGGSGPMEIHLPEGAGVRVRVDSGSGPFTASGRFQRVDRDSRYDMVWETSDYSRAENTIDLTIDQGSGPIHLY